MTTVEEEITARVAAHRITRATDRAYEAADAVMRAHPDVTVWVSFDFSGVDSQPAHPDVTAPLPRVRFEVTRAGQLLDAPVMDGWKAAELMRRDLEGLIGKV